jgi:flagellar motor component MotA
MLVQRLVGLVVLWSALALFVSRTSGDLASLVHGPMFLMVVAVPVLVAGLAHGPRALAAALADAFGGGDLPAARRRSSALTLRTLGGASVAIGIVAVLLGMIGVMNTIASSGGQASPMDLAFGVAGLMVGPLYGVSVRVFLWDPLADAVEGGVDGVGAELEAAD